MNPYTTMKPLNKPIPFRGGILSVQASEFHYCQPKHDEGPYFSVEVAYMKDDKFLPIPELAPHTDDVYGYVPTNEVFSLLQGEGYTPSEIKNLLP